MTPDEPPRPRSAPLHCSGSGKGNDRKDNEQRQAHSSHHFPTAKPPSLRTAPTSARAHCAALPAAGAHLLLFSQPRHLRPARLLVPAPAPRCARYAEIRRDTPRYAENCLYSPRYAENCRGTPRVTTSLSPAAARQATPTRLPTAFATGSSTRSRSTHARRSRGAGCPGCRCPTCRRTGRRWAAVWAEASAAAWAAGWRGWRGWAAGSAARWEASAGGTWEAWAAAWAARGRSRTAAWVTPTWRCRWPSSSLRRGEGGRRAKPPGRCRGASPPRRCE